MYITLPKFKKTFIENENHDILLFGHVKTWLNVSLNINISEFDINQSFDNIDEKIDKNELSSNDYQLILTKCYNEEGNYISLNGAYNKSDPGLPIIKDLKKIVNDYELLNVLLEKDDLKTEMEKSLYYRISKTKEEIENYIKRFKELSTYLSKGILDKKKNKLFVLTTRKIKEYNDVNYIRLYMGNFNKESIENVIRFLYENRTVD
jgi:hypothetical protein